MAGSFVDVTLGPPGRKNRLQVTPVQVQWGDHAVNLTRVEHVAWNMVTLSVNLVRASASFQCWFADDRDEVSITVGAGRVRSQEERLAEASSALEAAMFEIVAPRLVEQWVGQLGQGGVITVGGREVIKDAVSGGVAGGIPGLVRKRMRSRTASAVELSSRGIELRGEKGAKAAWAWPSVHEVLIERAEAVLVADGERTRLLPTTYQDAVLLPRLVQGVRSTL
jgi:hypothetical protein